MKNIILFVLTGSFLLGCTRAVDAESTKIVIQLPQFTKASLKSGSLPAKNSKVTGLDVGNEDEENSDDEFSTIMATPASGDYPINCYLVGIGGPEPSLNVNFAGRNDAAEVLQPEYKFGPYVGLRPAGDSIEFIVNPGEQRIIYFFGVHALNMEECHNLQTERPDKSNFTKPHLIGKSEYLKFVAGQEMIVPISLNDPVATNQMDDFYFPSFGEKTLLPMATHIAVENSSFPQNILRKNTGAFACEPLDIILRSGENSGLGILSYPVQASIRSQDSMTQSTIYTDYSRCINNTADTAVTIPSGQSSVRVWTRAISSDPSSADLSVAVSGLAIGSTLQSLNRRFQILNEFQYKYEIIAPKATVINKCVPIKINYRKLFGYFSTDHVLNFNIEPRINGSLMHGLVSFYESTWACTAGNPAVTASSISSGDSSHAMFMKVHSDQYSDIGLQVTHVAGNNTLADYTSVRINKDSTLSPVISSIRFKYKNYFKTGICIPLELSFYDQKGNYISGDQINPSRTLQIDLADSNNSEVTLYRNSSDCSSGVVTGGTVNVVTSNMYDQFYIKANTTEYGPRSISLKLDTGVRQKIFFDIMDPSY